MPGYIAGVTNPMFTENENWWDIACILDIPNKTGQIRTWEEKGQKNGQLGNKMGLFGGFINDDILTLNTKDASNNIVGITSKIVATSLGEEDLNVTFIDNKFITNILSGIHILTPNYEKPDIENWVKSQFKDYTLSIITACNIYSENCIIMKQDNTDITNMNMNNNNNNNNNSNITAITSSEKSTGPHDNNIILHMNLNLFSLKYKRFYDSNIQRSMVLSEIDHIKLAYTSPWKWGHTLMTKQQPPAITVVKNEIKSDKNHINSNNNNNTTSTNNNDNNSQSSISVILDTSLINENSEREDHHDTYVIQKKNILRLQIEANIDPQDLEYILNEIYESLHNENSVKSLLVFMLESQGGLHSILLGLFSINPQVRLHVINIIDKISKYPSTKPSIDNMNSVFKNAYMRQMIALTDGRLEESIKRYHLKTRKMSHPPNFSSHNNSIHGMVAGTSTHGNSNTSGSVHGSGNNSRERSSTLTRPDFASYIDAFDILG